MATAVVLAAVIGWLIAAVVSTTAGWVIGALIGVTLLPVLAGRGAPDPDRDANTLARARPDRQAIATAPDDDAGHD